MEKNFTELCNKMVDEQLVARNIKSKTVLDAMRSVPRHLFVPENLQNKAYSDCALPIALNQTISQPYIVAFMTEQLNPRPGMKILEIGTGSGYQTAVLAHLGAEVFTIELLEELSREAEKIFIKLGLTNINTRHGNGFSGWQEEAPFDAIIVTAAPECIPQKLTDQLKDGGKMIVPVGPVHSVQSLKLLAKSGGVISERELLHVRFVPMVDLP